MTVLALFAIGSAFAAKPTSSREDWSKGPVQQRLQPWVPGTYSLMSAHDPDQSLLPPP